MTALLVELLIIAFTGIVGCISLLLSMYIKNVEDGTVCEQCDEDGSCFARKSIFKDSNYLSEFMLVSFLKVKPYCKQIPKCSFKHITVYILCNTILVIILFWSRGYDLTGVVFGVSSAMLLALSVVDWNTQYIPVEYTGVVFICGLIHLFADFSNWLEYLIGLIAVSGFLCIVNRIMTPMLKRKYQGEYEVSSGIGGGDIKLMAATGLLLGWKLNFIALGIGCVAGSAIHLFLMRIKKSGKQFAFGPYLSLGVYITMICGEQLVSWYLNMMGIKPL